MSKELFSGKADNYIKYRPSYSKEALDFLYNNIGITKDSIIGDIGSGPGNFSRYLLERGNHVYGIEPNTDMRETAEKDLKYYKKFHSLNGSAEETGLEDQSVDFITSAQSFHWFNLSMTKKEFQRILRSQGKVILLWNKRLISATEFMSLYEEFLLLNLKGYDKARHKSIGEKEFKDFFKDGYYEIITFPNITTINFEQLKGLVLSISYAPLPGDKDCEPLIKKLEVLFQKYAENNTCPFHYETKMYWGII
jgi:ubiquinone/menaquinone biosynthesis C-methylase UbiE